MKTLTPTVRRGNKTAGGAQTDEEKAKAAADAKAVADAAAKAKADADAKAGDSSLTEDQVQKMIGKALADTFNAELPKHLKGMITEEGIKTFISEEFKKLAKDSTTIAAPDVKTIVENAVKLQMDGVRKDKRFVLNPDDANQTPSGKGGSPDIDMPVSWTKGNLPLHGKQLLNLCQHKAMNADIPESMLAKGTALGDQMLSKMQREAKALEHHRGKALSSTGSNTGDEFVPTDLSAQLLRQFFLASNLAAVFMAREVAMPTDPYVYPLSTTRPQFYYESTENTAATASDPGTDKTTLTSVRLVGETDFSYELDEDSIIAILPTLQMLIAEGAADAWEDALINGDTTGTHQDTDTAAGSAKLPAKSIKGFRKLALAVSALKTDLSSGGVGTNANFLAVRKLLKKYGGDPRNLIWLASPTTAIAMQGISEVVSMEKFGTRATIITGEIAALQGIPIIASERVREDVDATGVNGASGNTKSTVQCINITRFLTGFRRQLMIEVWKDIKKGQNVVVGSFRKAFTPIITPSASITSVGIGYNFTP